MSQPDSTPLLDRVRAMVKDEPNIQVLGPCEKPAPGVSLLDLVALIESTKPKA